MNVSRAQCISLYTFNYCFIIINNCHPAVVITTSFITELPGENYIFAKPEYSQMSAFYINEIQIELSSKFTHNGIPLSKN
jgi:hypothetical protein